MCSSESLCEPSISLLSDGRWWPLQATLQKYKGQLLGLLSREEILSLESGKTKCCPLTSCVLCHTCTCTSNRNTCTHKHTHSQVLGKNPIRHIWRWYLEVESLKGSQSQMKSSGWCPPHGIRDFIIKLKIFTVFLYDTSAKCIISYLPPGLWTTKAFLISKLWEHRYFKNGPR